MIGNCFFTSLYFCPLKLVLPQYSVQNDKILVVKVLYYLHGILQNKEIFYMAEYSNKSLTIEKFYPANLVLKDS